MNYCICNCSSHPRSSPGRKNRSCLLPARSPWILRRPGHSAAGPRLSLYRQCRPKVSFHPTQSLRRFCPYPAGRLSNLPAPPCRRVFPWSIADDLFSGYAKFPDLKDAETPGCPPSPAQAPSAAQETLRQGDILNPIFCGASAKRLASAG